MFPINSPSFGVLKTRLCAFPDLNLGSIQPYAFENHILTPDLFIVSAVCCPRGQKTYKLQIFICSPTLTKCVRVYLDSSRWNPRGEEWETGSLAAPGTPS